MKKIFSYLNPIAYLGVRDYSIRFPLIVMLMLSIASEIFAYRIVHNPEVVGVYGIYLFLAFIIYFSLRKGLPGGYVAAGITILYYGYIVITRKVNKGILYSEVTTTIVLMIIYFALVTVIGWLKQRVDTLIEREANEKYRLRAILDQLPVGVLIADEEGNVTKANKQAELLLGKDVYTNQLMNQEEWPMNITRQTGQDIIGKEFITEENGKKLYLKVNASSIRNQEGKVIAAASIVHDITGEKELEERKDEFIGMASHELKTPLTSLLLYTELLMRKLRKIDDRDALQAGTKMKMQLDKLTHLVSDLLDVSRIESGKLILNKTEFNIQDLTEEVIETIGTILQHHVIVFERGEDILIYADRDRIAQVLVNLLTNAAKYSPNAEKIIVTIEKENDTIQISIQDFGIGIASDMQNKVFERFFRADDVTAKTYPGLGMGLYISSEIATRHHGRIMVTSEKGIGSTFTLILPCTTKL